MKLSCLQENLSKGLGIVGRAVPARTTLPVTNNVLLATENGQLKLVATNLKIAITSWIGAQIEEEGEITIPARLLTDFINSLTNDKVEIDLKAGSKMVEFRCARSQSHISGIDAQDFPPIPTVSEGPIARIKAEDLRESISHVVFSAATEDTRQVLTGTHMLIEDSKLTMAGADGFRLAVYDTSLHEPMAEKMEIIIPATTFAEIGRLLVDQEDPVEIQIAPNQNQVLFRLKNTELLSQLIPGTFPKYNQLIPQKWTTRTVISVPDFLRATKAASIFARDGSGIVRLHSLPGGELQGGKVVVSARAEEIGDNQTEFDAVIAGEESKIAFNGKYLLDVLGVLKEGQVALETTNPTSPGVLRPIGSDNYLHVIMPMFVQW